MNILLLPLVALVLNGTTSAAPLELANAPSFIKRGHECIPPRPRPCKPEWECPCPPKPLTTARDLIVVKPGGCIITPDRPRPQPDVVKPPYDHVAVHESGCILQPHGPGPKTGGPTNHDLT